MKVVREADLPVRTLVGRTAVVFFGDGSGSEVLTHSVAYFDVGHAPGHDHASDEVFFVDSGAGEVWLDGVPCAVGPGTLVHTPGNVEHSVQTRPGGHMRLVAFASPHMVPGSYPDLPPRSADLPEATSGGASQLAIREATDPGTGRGLGVSIETERIDVAVRRISGGEAVDLAANGRDLVVNILEGTGEVRADGSLIAISAGSAGALNAMAWGRTTECASACTRLNVPPSTWQILW